MMNELKQEIQKRIDHYISIANEKTLNRIGMHLQGIEFDFNLSGRAAGIAYLNEQRISINPTLFNENIEYFFNHTIPHEVAHIVVHLAFGKQSRPHGKFWKYIMEHIFKVKANTYHTLDTTNVIKRNTKKFEYSCSCKTPHWLSTNIHNKIQKGSVRLCNKCSTKVQYEGNVSTKTAVLATKKKINKIKNGILYELQRRDT